MPITASAPLSAIRSSVMSATVAGSPPASANTRTTSRPRMPPAALTSPDAGHGARCGTAARIGEHDIDLAPEDAAGGIHLARGEQGARLAGRPPQSRRAALRDEEGDAQAIGPAPRRRRPQVEPIALSGEQARDR